MSCSFKYFVQCIMRTYLGGISIKVYISPEITSTAFNSHHSCLKTIHVHYQKRVNMARTAGLITCNNRQLRTSVRHRPQLTHRPAIHRNLVGAGCYIIYMFSSSSLKFDLFGNDYDYYYYYYYYYYFELISTIPKHFWFL